MPVNDYTNPRIDHASQKGDPLAGRVRVDLGKCLWLSTMFTLGTAGAALTATVGSVVLFVVFTLFTLCFGHSLGMHRLLIHRSFTTPRWFEYLLVHLGTIVGLAGPITMLRTHDVRDWAQRQTACHSFFTQQSSWLTDAGRQLFCRFEFEHPPQLIIEERVIDDPIYRWMEKYWHLQQLPWVAIFYVIGGYEWVIWGICSRITAGVLGHWIIGYFAHNHGGRRWEVLGAAVQGHNVSWTSLLTMGECWHNNHHAFPDSARLGLEKGQWDPGWWMLRLLERIGLASGITTAADLPTRQRLRDRRNRVHPSVHHEQTITSRLSRAGCQPARWENPPACRGVPGGAVSRTPQQLSAAVPGSEIEHSVAIAGSAIPHTG